MKKVTTIHVKSDWLFLLVQSPCSKHHSAYVMLIFKNQATNISWSEVGLEEALSMLTRLFCSYLISAQIEYAPLDATVT